MAEVNGKTFSKKLSTKETLLRMLDNYENSAREVVEALLSVSSHSGPRTSVDETIVTKAVDTVIERDEELQSALKLGEEQLVREQTIASMKEEIAKKDQELIQIQSQLRDAEQLLSSALYHANKKVDALKKASKASVSSEELIKFAFRISSGGSVEAPPDWTPGDPRRPYPLDIELRAGHLGHQLANSDDVEASRLNQTTMTVPDTSMTSLLSNSVSSDHEQPSVDKHSQQDTSASSLLYHLSQMANNEIVTAPIATASIAPSTVSSGVPTSALNNALPTQSDEVEFMPSSCDSTSSDSS